MAWTQTDIDTLRAAIATGGAVKSVTIADQTTIFRTLDEMLNLLAAMQAEVSPPQRTRFATTTKGLDS